MEQQTKQFSWLNPSLEVRHIAELGELGVVAKCNIEQGALLAAFGGYVIRDTDEATLLGSLNDSGIQIAEDLILSSYDHQEETDRFNHSCEPNAGLRGQCLLVALRDIRSDEQVCFDYATCLFRGKQAAPYSFECTCGQPTCRKRITDEDWKRPELQQKYRGHFSSFLEDKINQIMS